MLKAVGLDFYLSLYPGGFIHEEALQRLSRSHEEHRKAVGHHAAREGELEYLHDHQARKTMPTYRAPMHMGLVVRSWGISMMLVDYEHSVG